MASRILLKQIHRITATLVLRSGLHVGAGKDAIEIGGIDSPVVKNPFTAEPYIPGSSIKGKLRSLLEWALGRIEDDGAVWGSDKRGFETGKYRPDDPILRIFGATSDDWEAGPTRLIVRDAYLDETWAEQVRAQGLALTEEKTEVSIDRIQGKAARMGPRRMERVPAGARFQLEMSFKVFEVDGDDGATDRSFLNRLLEALRLLARLSQLSPKIVNFSSRPAWGGV
jgi:CRISPR-associated protein Csm3